MFVSGPRLVRVGKAGQEADGGEVGGGGGGVGLRGEAARRSGAASEVAVWACGVAAAARAAATAPGLRLFILGALGGVAGVWEARESGVWCMRFSAEPEGEHMRTSGLLGAGGGGAAGAGAGAAGWAKLGAVAEAVRSRIQAVQMSWACRHLSTFAISCRRAATGGSPPAHAFRRASPRVQRCGGCVRSQHACSPPAPSASHAWAAWDSSSALQQGAVHARRPGRR
jgi:hypothetical protein